jgi:two-component system LytT family response regulator
MSSLSPASSMHAIQAIRFSALDYLVKPVLGDELCAAIDRHLAKRGTPGSGSTRICSHNIAQPDERTMKLTLTSGDRSYFVDPAERGLVRGRCELHEPSSAG